MATGVPKYSNLPGIFLVKNDGGIVPEATASAPRVLVIGTAAEGGDNGVGTNIPYLARTTQLARIEFGTSGTLVRGMYEAKKAGAQEIALMRIGSTAASVAGIGGEASGSTGYTVTTVMKDDQADETYSVYYDDTTDRLIVWNETTTLVVYDNYPSATIDLGEVVVSGNRDNAQIAGYWDNIGTASAGVTIAAIASLSPSQSDYVVTTGTDGVTLSRMELYENLYKAYKLLLDYQFDVIIPMDAYLDDYNSVDQGRGSVQPLSNNGANTYPTAGDYNPSVSIDALGYCYAEEYQGTYYFWWRFAGSGATADIFPASVGSASATTKTDGTALVAADFHEVNFGYQLGRFLFDYSTNTNDATGVIGVRPPASIGLPDMATWIGTEPTYTLNTQTNLYYIAAPADNGSGLLGNKFMGGQSTYYSGQIGGGFIATSTEWLDGGDVLYDDNNYMVDLGRYFSVVLDWAILSNDYLAGGSSYVSSWAPSYAGMYSVLPPNSAPTNKLVSGTRLYYRIGPRKMDSLVGRGYVVLRTKEAGVVVADSPTAALPLSDWKRLSTVRITKDITDKVREVLDPFIGEGTTDSSKAAMHTAVDGVLLRAKKTKYLISYREFEIIQTADQRARGQANVTLVVVPAFELREITVTVSLAKE
jgi:hypothetical protein